jgi:hypothetical protein
MAWTRKARLMRLSIICRVRLPLVATFVTVAVAGFLSSGAARGNGAPPISWLQQFGTSHPDYGQAVAADALGNVFISGVTGGDLAGPVSTSSSDIYLSKFATDGNVAWTRQFSLGFANNVNGNATDGLGNAYIAGFFANFDSAGNVTPEGF